jgi:hypothetical protein
MNLPDRPVRRRELRESPMLAPRCWLQDAESFAGFTALKPDSASIASCLGE